MKELKKMSLKTLLTAASIFPLNFLLRSHATIIIKQAATAPNNTNPSETKILLE